MGGGGTLGIFVVRNLAIEAEGAFVSTNTETGDLGVDNTPIRGRLTYHIPLGGNASAIRIGAGYVRNMYSRTWTPWTSMTTAPPGYWDFASGWVRSLRSRSTGSSTTSPVPPDGAALDNYMNFGVQAGVVILLGNSYDKDKDGVEDGADRCPGTPAGETVDAGGCAASQRDTDSRQGEGQRRPLPQYRVGGQGGRGRLLG